jgi:D-alanyl-D-alanine carboxypeptidase
VRVKETALKERLESIRAESGIPAVAVLVDDSAWVGVRPAGTPENIRPDDPFHIGSSTKAMTATLAARFVEQGNIRWETTIAEAIPHLKQAIHRNYHAVIPKPTLIPSGWLTRH